jgi:hypothetical protein
LNRSASEDRAAVAAAFGVTVASALRRFEATGEPYAESTDSQSAEEWLERLTLRGTIESLANRLLAAVVG